MRKDLSAPARSRHSSIPNTPAPLANNWKQYNNLLGSGINFWAIDPHAMDNPEAFWKSLYPDTTRQAAPGITWAVWMKETAGYLQADFGGQLGSMSYSGNVGVRVIHTDLQCHPAFEPAIRANTAPSPPMPAPRSRGAATTTSCRRPTSR